MVKRMISIMEKSLLVLFILSKATNDLAKDVDPLVLRLTRSIRDA